MDAIKNDALASIHGGNHFKILADLPWNVNYKRNSNTLVFSPVGLTHPG